VDILSTMLLMSAATIGMSSTEIKAHERVDLIEINHFYDEHGKRVFDQIIFYDWCPVESRYQVRAWRLLKSPYQLPQRRWEQRDYIASWHDGDVYRQIIAKTVRETWTQYDPELVEREYLPKEKRRELIKPIGQ